MDGDSREIKVGAKLTKGVFWRRAEGGFLCMHMPGGNISLVKRGEIVNWGEEARVALG